MENRVQQKQGDRCADHPGRSALRHKVQIGVAAGQPSWSLPGIKLAPAKSTVNLQNPENAFATD
jgi:hypothetical protein